MRHIALLGLVSLVCALFISCSQPGSQPAGPHATVALRDGTTYTGTVVKTSPTQITVAGDDQTTRTFDMKDVRAVDYGEQAAETQPPEPQPSGSKPSGQRAARPPAASTLVERTHPPEAAITTKTYELPSGTQVSVRTDETIDSAKAIKGQTFAAEVYRDVVDGSGDVVLPRGSNAQIVIRSSSGGGRVSGSPELVLDLESVSVDGRRYVLDTVNVSQRGKEGLGKNKRTAEYVGGGAALGAIIGAIAGHGKGAAIGAASGAAAGAATQVITRGGAIRVPAETVLTFRLDKPLQVTPAR